MRERITARVLLFDPDGRILLMKGRLPSDPGAPGAWFTVGGGVEPGESLAEAALREIREETGFTDACIGEVLWEGQQIHHDRKGRPVLIRETFLAATCAGGDPDRAGWQAQELEFVDDIRWWTPDELAQLSEPIFPPDLPARLPEVLAALQFTTGSSTEG